VSCSSRCLDLLLTFDDVALGELCVFMTLVPVLKANIPRTRCLSYEPQYSLRLYLDVTANLTRILNTPPTSVHACQQLSRECAHEHAKS